MVVRAVPSNKLGMRTILDNFTMREHENHISFLNCTQTMRYSNNRLLFLLLSYAGRIFTRFEIMSEIWGYETDSDERVVDTHIKKLRAKFENSKDFEIITVRGLGYKAVKKERA